MISKSFLCFLLLSLFLCDDEAAAATQATDSDQKKAEEQPIKEDDGTAKDEPKEADAAAEDAKPAGESDGDKEPEKPKMTPEQLEQFQQQMFGQFDNIMKLSCIMKMSTYKTKHEKQISKFQGMHNY